MNEMPKNSGRAHWWEGIAILLALVSIWPWILHWPNPFWQYFAWAMLGLMVVVFVLRFRRLWRMGHPPRRHR